MNKASYAIVFCCFILAGCTSAPSKDLDSESVSSFRSATLESSKTEEEVRTNQSKVGMPKESAMQEKSTVDDEPANSGMYQGSQAFTDTEQYVETVLYSKNQDLISPKLLFATEDAIKVNAEIEEQIRKLEIERKGSVFSTYHSTMSEEVISVLMQVENLNLKQIKFYSYNFDRNTGRRLEIDDAIAFAGMDWEKVKEIFYKERKSYWQGVARGKSEDFDYREYLNQELNDFREAYEEGKLAIIIDEEGLLSVVCSLINEIEIERTKNLQEQKYWQLYCVTDNRPKLLQRNSYGSEFKAVVIEEPTEEELANIKVIKYLTEDEKISGKKKYLVLPLVEGLRFEWVKKTRMNEEKEEIIWKSDILLGEDAIYIEVLSEDIVEDRYFGLIYNEEKKRYFYPNKEFQHNQVEESILYLDFD